MIEVIPIDEHSPNQILDDAKKDDLDYVLLIGQKEDGWYFSASDPDGLKSMAAAQQFLNFMMSR